MRVGVCLCQPPYDKVVTKDEYWYMHDYCIFGMHIVFGSRTIRVNYHYSNGGEKLLYHLLQWLQFLW